MFVVLFEVEPRPERWDDYLHYAGMLRPELEQIDGFLDNRRFRSRRHDGRLLSLSFWRDEKSVVRWRSHAMHHGVQAKGRSEVFRDYHLRVGEVVSDNGAAQPQARFDETETGLARAASIIEGAARPKRRPKRPDWWTGTCSTASWIQQDRLLLLSWRDADAMQAWTPQAGTPAARCADRARLRAARSGRGAAVPSLTRRPASAPNPGIVTVTLGSHPSLPGAPRRTYPPPGEPRIVRQAGDCFVAAAPRDDGGVRATNSCRVGRLERNFVVQVAALRRVP